MSYGITPKRRGFSPSRIELPSRSLSVRPAAHPGAREGVRKMSIPASARPAELQPTSWNEVERTIDVVWTTGARAIRYDWEADRLIDEELATEPGAVRLDRLNSGAPVLDNHNRSTLGSQIGVVVPGSARMVSGQGIATLKLSSRDDLASIVADIGAGIIRNISVGYRVLRFDITKEDGDRPLYRAVDWEPFEISFVPVPADAGAQVRSSSPSLFHACDLHTRFQEQSSMSDFNNPDDVSQAGASSSEMAISSRVLTELRQAYRQLGAEWRLNQGEVDTTLLDLAERGLTRAQIGREMSAIFGEIQRRNTDLFGAPSGVGGPTIDFTAGAATRMVSGASSYNNPNFLGEAISDALYCRMSGKQPTEQARQFMGYTMTDMAAELVERVGGQRVRGMRPEQILDMAAGNAGTASGGWVEGYSRHLSPGMGTAHFPALLLSAGNRFLIDVFNGVGSPIKTVGRRRTAADFRAISGLQLSGFGTLLEVQEHGEIKHDVFTERKETYRVKTFAKMFTLTRQAIINDDLGAFSDPTRLMARASAETEAQLLAGLLNDNPQLSDGKALFHADHGNLANAGAAPSEAALSAARFALRSQRDLDGVTPINPQPRYVLASAKYETEWEKLLSTPLQPTQVDQANPFAGKLAPLIDPRLADNPWYLFADPETAPVIEYAYLDGTGEGPQIEMKDGWDRLGTSFRVVLDFGCGLVDHRGGFKNPGA